MKNDSLQLGQILLNLNTKVNKRASYLHKFSYKYHRGIFSHDFVIKNLKNEPCLQTPRSFIPIEIKYKDKFKRITRVQEKSSDISLRASLVKFHQKEPSKPGTRNRSYQTCRLKF